MYINDSGWRSSLPEMLSCCWEQACSVETPSSGPGMTRCSILGEAQVFGRGREDTEMGQQRHMNQGSQRIKF